MRINFIKIRMAYHEKLHIPATCENFLRRKENTIYGVLFIHYEQWICGEIKTEIGMKFDHLTYTGIKKNAVLH